MALMPGGPLESGLFSGVIGLGGVYDTSHSNRTKATGPGHFLGIPSFSSRNSQLLTVYVDSHGKRVISFRHRSLI